MYYIYMFVVHLNINCNSVNYYFNIKRNARLFERKILLYVYDDIEQNDEKHYRDSYFLHKEC
jgi:hypothetical protein